MKNNLHKWLKTGISSLILGCLLVSVVFAEGEILERSKGDLEYLKSVIDMIKDKYKDAITEEELIDGAVKGMFNTMDKYTVYYTKNEAESFFKDMSGNYSGIGVSFTEYQGKIIITDVFKESPAQGAGINPGDIILKVNGIDIKGKELNQIVNLISGKSGTKVILDLLKEGQTKAKSVVIVRKEIRVSPVSYSIENGVGYIKLSQFSSNANYYMTLALEEMEAQNITKIILDLRDNPGGDVNEVVAIAQKFIPKGLITKLDFKSEVLEDEEFYSDMEKIKYKLVLLVNEMSASASEILAGAVKDREAGVIVGTNTYGKGKVQNLLPILSKEASEKYEKQLGIKIVDAYDLQVKYGISPLEHEITGWTKMTTGKYYTPKGLDIDGIGIAPHFLVENNMKYDYRGIVKLQKISKPYLGSESFTVNNAEKMLLFLGYDVDTPDMIMDFKMLKAVAKFQKEMGLYSYGILDFSTQQLLNQRFENEKYKLDKQYQKALEILKK